MSNKGNLKCIINVGISASGKSTWTKQFLAKNPNYVSVSRDDFRYGLRNTGVTENKIEDLISNLVDQTIIQSLNKRLNVIIDATNLKEKYIKHFIELVKYKADIEFRIFDVPVEVCIERDKNRERSVGEKVIRNQYKDYKNLIDCYAFQNVSMRPRHEDRFVHAEQDKNLPEAILFDIDGTLALMGNRSPYDWLRVDVDDPNDVVIDHIQLHKNAGRKIILVSGRDEFARQKTEYWLKFYNIYYDELLMRPKDDVRKDTIIKKEIYENYIKPRFYVCCIYDDRLSVIEMWKNLGLFVFNVNILNRDF